MGKWTKFRRKLLEGNADNNISFSDLCNYCEAIGFKSHPSNGSSHNHIYGKDGVAEIINLQPDHGGKGKSYQVKQVRKIIKQYDLSHTEDEAADAENGENE